MTQHLEQEPPRLSKVSRERPTSNKLPHGVAPETYGLLLFARDHKEILDIVDSLDKGKNRIVNPTRKLLYVYYFNDVSIRDLRKYLGGDRTTNGKRMLAALEVIWQNVPPEIQSQYPKEKAVKLKENQSNSNNPGFIAKMREVGKRRGSPMDGKTHSDTTILKIRKTAQEIWNKRHGIEDIHEPLEKRNLLFAEWLRITQSLQRYPTSFDIKKLREQDKTKFSKTMYNREFGDGSFSRAKEKLDRLTTLAGPSFEAAQKFIDYLTGKAQQLAKYQISKEDIQRHSVQIKEARFKILLATSEEEANQGMERLNLLLSRIQRKISVMTPFTLDDEHQ